MEKRPKAVHLPPSHAEILGIAAANVDPAALPAGTRSARAKGALLRVLRVYTYRQVLFNRAALSLLESLDATLRRLIESIRASAESLEDRLEPLELRAGDLEKDVAELQGAAAGGPSGDPFPTEWYRAFEDHFRGPRTEVLERQAFYVPILRRAAGAAGPGAILVDLGCGRGELLEIAAGAGLPARGFDQNASMVELCRSLSLDVTQKDLRSALDGFPDGSLAAVSALQVIEHLPWAEIRRLIERSHRKLRPGGCLILETINPASLYAWRSFHADPTHRQPVPEPTCRFLLERTGFREIESHFLHPVQDPDLAAFFGRDPGWKPLADFLLGFQDYALVGWRSP